MSTGRHGHWGPWGDKVTKSTGRPHAHPAAQRWDSPPPATRLQDTRARRLCLRTAQRGLDKGLEGQQTPQLKWKGSRGRWGRASLPSCISATRCHLTPSGTVMAAPEMLCHLLNPEKLP